MLKHLRNAALIGVGGTAIAVEKTNDHIQQLVNKGKLSVQEGKQLTNELIKRKDSEEITELDREQLEALLIEMNVAQRNDIEELEKKIRDLENRVEDKNNSN